MPDRQRLKPADVVALVLLSLLVAAVLLPVFIYPAQESARRVACGNNTCQLGLAMIQYAGDHDDGFMPLVDAQGNEVPAVDADGHISTLPARSGFAVLIKEGYLTTEKVFICPSSGDRLRDYRGGSYKSDPLASLVLSDANCSYGWDPTKKHSVDATCAIIADKPPLDVTTGGDGSPQHNSPNHHGEGQNVFYNDGHRKWMSYPVPDAGGDPDIYTGAPGYERSNTDAKIIR